MIAITREAQKPVDELLTMEEVAAFFKVEIGTVRAWRNNGEGPEGFRVGKYVRYRRSAVERHLAELEERERELRS